MSAIKPSIIMRDQANKQWLTEDFDKHWEEDPFQAIGTAITVCIGITVALIVAIVGIVVIYGPALGLLK